MLAEPRRKKVKRSRDPQNLEWSSDKEKFGYKMLEKMGWREGEGLGISNTGITKHISVSVKSDNKGLGADSNFKYYDWKGEFDNVLKSMNKASSLSYSDDDECYANNKKSISKLHNNDSIIKDVSIKSNTDMFKLIRQDLHNDCFAVTNEDNTILTYTHKTDMKTYFNQKKDRKRKMENAMLEGASITCVSNNFCLNKSNVSTNCDITKFSPYLTKIDKFKKKKHKTKGSNNISQFV